MRNGERLYEELMCLSAKRNSKVKTSELKRISNVGHNKTIYRDIDILKSLDCDIDSVGGRDGGFTLQSAPTIYELATLGEDEEFRTMLEIFDTDFLHDRKEEFPPALVDRFKAYVKRILASYQMEDPVHRKEQD